MAKTVLGLLAMFLIIPGCAPAPPPNAGLVLVTVNGMILYPDSSTVQDTSFIVKFDPGPAPFRVSNGEFSLRPGPAGSYHINVQPVGTLFSWPANVYLNPGENNLAITIPYDIRVVNPHPGKDTLRVGGLPEKIIFRRN